MAAIATTNNDVVEAGVAVGLAARSLDNSIEEQMLATSAEEDQIFFEELEHIEEEQLQEKLNSSSHHNSNDDESSDDIGDETDKSEEGDRSAVNTAGVQQEVTIEEEKSSTDNKEKC